jgi:ABC-type sulfate/molybdate transport systems ATPase subunit
MTLAVAIGKRLGDFTLEVDFQTPPGISVLFGPSGAGKTLTLRCIAGLERPDHGRIALGQRVLFDQATRTNVPVRQRQVGYLFQQYALFPHLTVSANIGYGLHRLDSRARDERVRELLELVGLTDCAARHPRELSGGQAQRVALARALARQPEVLLLDEPFAAVDALTRGQLRRELRAIQERTGVPMLLITHDFSEVRQLAGFVLVYDQGRILQSGPPLLVRDQPADEKVAALLRAASLEV